MITGCAKAIIKSVWKATLSFFVSAELGDPIIGYTQV